MSVYKFDMDSFLRQIRVNSKAQRLEWQPWKLEDNIFELWGFARQIFGIYKMLGEPYQINEKENIWAYDYSLSLDEARDYEDCRKKAGVLKK